MSIFDTNTSNAPVSVDQLVGEGKKYASVEDLAKAYINASTFIDHLKVENEGIRTDLSSKLTEAEELRLRLEAAERQRREEAPRELNKPVEDTKIDLTAAIKEQIEKTRKEETAQRNIESVTVRLLSEFGDENKANEFVKAKALELGVGVEFLQSIAVQSPKAFFNQIGLVDNAPNRQVAAPHSEVNTAALVRNASAAPGSPGTKEYFDNIRKTNPTEYWKPAVQNAIFKARQAGTYQI